MDVTDLIADTPMFSALTSAEQRALAALAEPFSLRSGQCLYQEGSAPEYLYLLVSGRLRVSRQDQGLLAYVGRLELVGEVGAITGDTHSTDVHAVRDSRLLRFPRTELMALLGRSAPTLMALTQQTLRRIARGRDRQRKASTASHGTIALLAVSPGVDLQELAMALLERWSGWPQARLVTARHVDAELGAGAALADDNGDDRLGAWLHALESRHRYVIYAADNGDNAWAQRCLRHADRALMVVEAGAEPRTPEALARMPEAALRPPVEMVFLRANGDPSPHTRAWLEATSARAHYFVHPWSPRDLNALASQVSGRGIGLVLGGGGARGFAHIGMIRALEQLHIPVDIMGGTSMGAFISALLACGYDSVEIEHIARETFVNNNYLNDYTVPRVSLIQGRRFLGRLEEIFGERRIEDLRRSYYCISTSLTTGSGVIHNHGSLAAWVGTSMAIPGIAPPISYRGELLCDGGVVDNLPTVAMQVLERGTIIACSVSTQGDIRAPGPEQDLPDPLAVLQKQNRELAPGFREILMRTATLTADTVIHREAAAVADILVNMPVAGYSLFDWKQIDALIELGYQHGLRELAPLRDSLLQRG